MKHLALLFVLAAAIAALVTCARDDGQPDPPLQTLVPCDPSGAAGDPLACPPDAAVDAAPDAAPDAAVDAPIDTVVPDAVVDAS
jgi:hypothetical protein